MEMQKEESFFDRRARQEAWAKRVCLMEYACVVSECVMDRFSDWELSDTEMALCEANHKLGRCVGFTADQIVTARERLRWRGLVMVEGEIISDNSERAMDAGVGTHAVEH